MDRQSNEMNSSILIALLFALLRVIEIVYLHHHVILLCRLPFFFLFASPSIFIPWLVDYTIHIYYKL